MKKNLAKRIVLGLLTGVVLMSNSVAWADTLDYGYNIDLNQNYQRADIPDDSLSIGGDIAERKINDNGKLTSQGSIKSVAIGVGSVVGSEGQALSDNVALGYFAEVGNCSGGTAIGSMTKANATNSTALGFSAVANGLGSVALGSGSKVKIAEQYVVSVGAGGESGGFKNIGTEQNPNNVPNTRHIINITNVAVDDLDDSDYGSYAVNVNTLNAALARVQPTDLKGYATEQYVNSNFVRINAQSVVESGITVDVTGGKENPIVMDDDGITVGKDSARMDGTGFYVWDGQPHDVDNAKASMTNNGAIRGASGKFIVDGATGNVTASSYIIKDSNGNETNIKTALDSKANAADVYTKTETDTELAKKANQSDLVAETDERKKADTALEQKIADLGGGNSAAIAGINQRLDKTNAKINKVGAGAAALAALHPLEYDPDDKLTFSAGMGNYAGENAAALGAFYRPNEKIMVSLGGTMGNGENMVNLGLSIGLDKPNGLAKLSKRELIQKVNAMEAEMAEMKAMLQAIMAKK